MARKKNTTVDDPWGATEVLERPRDGLEEVARERKKAKRIKRALVALLGLAVLAVFGSLAVIGTAGTAQDTPQSASDVLNPPGRAEADDAVRLWLAHDPAPLPGAHVVSWDGAQAIPFPQDTDSPTADADAPQVQRWTHTFTVQVDATYDPSSGSELTPTRTYTLTQLVAYTPEQGAAAVGEPSMTPDAPTSETLQVQEAEWPHTKTTTPSDAIRHAIDAWVAAYTSGNSASLGTVVSDPDTAHAYVPLTGIVQAKWESLGSAYKLTDSDVKANADSTDTEIVQISLQLDRQGVTQTDNVTLPEMHLDLLITGAQGGSPKIVAWGAPGTGHLLTPYQNATTLERAGSK